MRLKWKFSLKLVPLKKVEPETKQQQQQHLSTPNPKLFLLILKKMRYFVKIEKQNQSNSGESVNVWSCDVLIHGHVKGDLMPHQGKLLRRSSEINWSSPVVSGLKISVISPAGSDII